MTKKAYQTTKLLQVLLD